MTPARPAAIVAAVDAQGPGLSHDERDRMRAVAALAGTLACCPVCHGRQTVDPGFYDGIALGTAPETCRTCDGRGAVAVETLPVVSIPSCWTRGPGEPSVVTYISPTEAYLARTANAAPPPWLHP